jgi:hypothetical protein
MLVGVVIDIVIVEEVVVIAVQIILEVIVVA